MTPESPSDPNTIDLGWACATDVGEGPVVLGIHGLPGSVRDFRWLGSALEPQLRFVRVDLPGFGGTPMGDSASPKAIADFIAKFIEEYIKEPVVVLGHSYGSIHAAEVGYRFPEWVQGVGLVNPWGIEPHRGYRNTPNFELMRRAMRTPAVKSLLNPLVVKQFKSAGFKRINALEARRTFDRLAHFEWPRHIEAIRGLQQSTLVCWCDDDYLIEADIVQRMADIVPEGPRLRFETGGHNSQKTHAVELADAIVPWVNSL